MNCEVRQGPANEFAGYNKHEVRLRGLTERV